MTTRPVVHDCAGHRGICLRVLHTAGDNAMSRRARNRRDKRQPIPDFTDPR